MEQTINYKLESQDLSRSQIAFDLFTKVVNTFGDLASYQYVLQELEFENFTEGINPESLLVGQYCVKDKKSYYRTSTALCSWTEENGILKLQIHKTDNNDYSVDPNLLQAESIFIDYSISSELCEIIYSRKIIIDDEVEGMEIITPGKPKKVRSVYLKIPDMARQSKNLLQINDEMSLLVEEVAIPIEDSKVTVQRTAMALPVDPLLQNDDLSSIYSSLKLRGIKIVSEAEVDSLESNYPDKLKIFTPELTLVLDIEWVQWQGQLMPSFANLNADIRAGNLGGSSVTLDENQIKISNFETDPNSEGLIRAIVEIPTTDMEFELMFEMPLIIVNATVKNASKFNPGNN